MLGEATLDALGTFLGEAIRVEYGVGVAVVPETAARRCRRTMALDMLRLTDSWAMRQLIVCVRGLDLLPAHARRLVQHLAKSARTDA